MAGVEGHPSQSVLSLKDRMLPRRFSIPGYEISKNTRIQKEHDGWTPVALSGSIVQNEPNGLTQSKGKADPVPAITTTPTERSTDTSSIAPTVSHAVKGSDPKRKSGEGRFRE